MSKNFTFANAPSIQMRRSRISGLSYGVNTSMSLGTLYPFYVEEVLPGDSFKVKSDMVLRLTSSFLKPIYGNMYADVFYFFVPWRLVFDDFPCVFGENKNGYWANQQVYNAPTLTGQEVFSKSIADYLEMPVGNINTPLNVMYHRALALIWNEWFRDENYQEPVHIQKGAANALGEAMNNRPWAPDNYTGMCPPVSKYRDYFTSVLPNAQKGSAVEFSAFGDNLLPVVTGNTRSISPAQYPGIGFTSRFVVDGTFPAGDGMYNVALRSNSDGTGGASARGILYADSTPESPINTGIYDVSLVPNNLYADPSQVPAISVNELRMAFAAQKILERDALGTRYVEHILNTFGVSNPDARVQRPELLNAGRININVQQVASTVGTDEAYLAELGGYSLSSGKCGFSKAFSEYGCILGVVALRQYHSYSQGMPKRYTRSKRLDYYNPALAYVGMMPVKSTEIYAGASTDDIFGYQRAWAEYRHHQNAITGEMRSDAENTLDIWHLGDDYSSQPYAGAEFISETPANLNRVITVDSSRQDQFIADIWHDVEAIRVMPANPMPGLIDHY